MYLILLLEKRAYPENVHPFCHIQVAFLSSFYVFGSCHYSIVDLNYCVYVPIQLFKGLWYVSACTIHVCMCLPVLHVDHLVSV